MRTRSKKRNKINVITLGCSKNIYDSEIIIKQLEASKKNVVHEEKGNIVVINTCGFINNAKQESIDTILEQIEYKQTGIVDKVYVTGCLSERYKNDLEKDERFYFCKTTGIAYPILQGVPIFLKNNGIVASKYLDFDR